MNTFKLEHLTQKEGNIVTNETNLSICLTANGFCFALVDKNFSLKAVGEFTVDLTGSITQVMMNMKTCFASIGIRIFNFSSIKVVCPTERSTWIPFKLYDASQNKAYLSKTCAVYSSDSIIANTVEKVDAVCIFACPLHIHSGIKILMPKAEFVCPSQVMTSYAYDVASFMQNTFILYKRDGGCEAAIFKGNEFILSNSFSYKTPQDLIYYILFTLQQLEIDTANVSLLISGDGYSEEELKTLKKYIKTVSHANCTENITVGSKFEGTDLQKYFLLLA